MARVPRTQHAPCIVSSSISTSASMYSTNDQHRAASHRTDDSFKVLVLGDSGVVRIPLSVQNVFI